MVVAVAEGEEKGVGREVVMVVMCRTGEGVVWERGWEVVVVAIVRLSEC